MKNLFESFAVFLVGLLSLVIIGLIVKYNMIEDGDILDQVAYEMPEDKEATQKEKATDYLKNIEGYEDIDVKVDATKENTANTVVVKSEEATTELDTTVEDKSKSAYMKNLADYEKNKDKVVKKQKPKPKPKPITIEPKKLEDEIEDTIGLAIEDALSDL